MKHSHEVALAAWAADLLEELRGEDLRAFAPQLVVAVPMHWWRRLWRGANPPGLLAERLSWRLSVACSPMALRWKRHLPPQASLSPTARRENVRAALYASRKRAIHGRRVLLVDDVMTTGATCHEAARALLAAGATEVAVAVVARA